MVTFTRFFLFSRSRAWRGAVVLAALGLGACSWVDRSFPDGRDDYKRSQSGPPLEVPPDLVEPERDNSLAVPSTPEPATATYSDYQQGGGPAARSAAGAVLPEQKNVRLNRDGDKAWLIAAGEPGQIWPHVREFFITNGFVLVVDDPAVGILETDWQERRAQAKQGGLGGVVNNLLGSVFSTGSRDKFRVRLERGSEAGTTEIYVTHSGLEEVVEGETSYEYSGTHWEARPANVELELEMLKRLAIAIGVPQEEAEGLAEKPQARTQLQTDGDGKIL